jgi:hypothetical protein
MMRIVGKHGVTAILFSCTVAAAACSGGTKHGAGFGDDAEEDGGSGQGPGGPGFEDDAATPACVGLQCQQVSCPTGGRTTVTGTVFAPNGKLPLYNAIVYVPNGEVQPFSHGVSCDVCGTAASGNPVVATLSGSDGKFTLQNVPVGTNIPLVIQLGRWRRKVVIPEVQGCIENRLDNADLTRLPRNQREGDLPRIAHTTGNCDRLGCMLPKIGIDPSEFGSAADGASKSIHTYVGAGGGSPPGAAPAQPFWTNLEKMKEYDMIIFSCECNEHLENKGGPAYKAVTDYLAAGGRIFTTDYMYDWYKYTPDNALKSSFTVPGGAPPVGTAMTLDTSFPKGRALADWLKVVFPASAPLQSGQVGFDVVFGNFKTANTTNAQVWAHSNGAPDPRIFTVNMPVGVAPEQQCGKGVHIDAHVNQTGSDTVAANYPLGCVAPLKEGEATLAFFFFDLAACIQNDGAAPPPPVAH